jgi:hypothetical protein
MNMLKEKIDFKKLQLLQGEITCSEEAVLSINPDENGYIRLGIVGEKAKMGSVSWTDDKYLVIDMLSDIDAMTTVDIIFYKACENSESNVLNYEMIPTKRVKLVIKLDELDSRRFFLPTLPGTLKGRQKGRPSNVSEMNRVEIIFHPGYSYNFKSLTLFEIYLSDNLPDMTVMGDPMVDEMGQWIQKDWNTKAHNIDEMTAYIKKEYERAEWDNQYPKGWSQYGGYTGLRFNATGYFHTHYDGNRWWLVDPEGYAFFSNGVCYGSRMGVFGFVDKMENLFSWLPEKDDPEYKEAWTTADHIAEFVKRNGAKAGKDRYMFNFARANMVRAFGAEHWWEAWVKINGARLKRWGFNTIGVGVNNYFDEDVMKFLQTVKIPFVWTLKKFPSTDNLIFRDFPDVYSEQYKERAKEFAEEQVSPFVGNPYMIGYFVNNEPEWKFQPVNLAERVFAHRLPLATKDALTSMLKDKYRTILALNNAWNTKFKAFEDLYIPIERIDLFSEQSAKDMDELHAVLLEKYASVTGDALRKVDPHHMNLGMRYSHFSRRELAGCEHYDIFSFNRYNPTVAEDLNDISSVLDIPVIIGEWHIGGGDKGLLSHGLLSAPTQEERGKACEYYLQGAMTHKNCVGAHYFEMNDQPLLGRFDGECMQHGIIDVCNREYDELVRHFINTNHHLYDFVLGKLEATKIKGQIRFQK